MIVQVNIILNKTVDDSDWRFDNLCGRDVYHGSTQPSGYQFKFMSKMTMGQLSANKKGDDILVYPIMKGFYFMSYFVTEDNNLLLFSLVWQTSKALMYSQ